MKAIVRERYGSPSMLQLRDVDKPAPKDGEVLLRVHAAGVDAGVWHAVTGLPYLARLFLGLRTPKIRVPGMDVAGRVEAVGGNVSEFQPGDEVFGTCDGSFAEYARARQGKVARKPASLTFEQAAVVPISACSALQGLRDQGRVRPGQRVLITGAGGGVGTFAVQLAKAFGAEVTGVCRSTKVELVRSIGADDVIDHARDDFTDGARRWDLILDTAGNRPLSRLRRALTPRGTLVLVGGEGGGRWLGGFQRQLLWTPMLSPFVGQRLRGLTSAVRGEDLRVLRELVEAGKVTPVVDRTYPLREAPDAIRYLREGRARGKLVVTV
jgi:NADPH:quinone reductase-like Zn-dependent oxidoreductase